MPFNFAVDVVCYVGFTGTQRGMTSHQKKEVRRILQDLNPERAHHGDCVGADADFHAICDAMRIAVVLHPPTDPKKRAFCEGSSHVRLPRPYLDRNHDIVRMTGCLIATPGERDEQLRSGTWATVWHARKCNRQIYLIFPNGDVVIENGQNNRG